ncbi:MAG: hypothetical protein EXQ94_15015, partial [Alphaproteobacteria bacterium]|nr:hypothetical protein [Alphaproteobacteria bacterium]
MAVFLLVVLVAGGPSAAQESGDDPVVLRVNGAEFHRSDLAAARDLLPQQYRDMPLELLYDPLIDQLINGKLILDRARAAKVEDDTAFLARLATVQEQLAREFYLRAEVEKASTDAALKALYDAH